MTNEKDYQKVIALTCTMAMESFAAIGRKLAAEYPAIFLTLADPNNHEDMVRQIYRGERDSDGDLLIPPSLRHTNLVQAIRYYRNKTGKSLRESKTDVETIVGR